MVGTARSTGCQRCRQKKRGCDQTQPACGPCQRANVPCVYEGRSWKFVDNQAQAARATDASQSPGSQASSDATDITLSSTLARSAMDVRIDDSFWTVLLPSNRSSMSLPPAYRVEAAPEFAAFRQLALEDRTVRLSLSALSVMVLGRLGKDNAQIRQGMRLYTQALRQTNRSLQHPAQYQSDSVLACSRLLSMYEMLRGPEVFCAASTQSDDWRRHIEGGCRILELRGPEKSVNPIGHQLFVSARRSAVICGICLKRPIISTDQAWSNVPWQDTSRNLSDELYDVLTAIPKLFRRQDVSMDAFDTMTSVDHHKMFGIGRGILHACLTTASQLQAWYLRMQAFVLQGYDMPGGSSTPDAGPMSPDQICEVLGYGFFELLATYWFAGVMLYTRIRVFHQVLIQVGQGLAADLPRLPEWMDPEPHALSIANHAELFLRPEAGIWGAQQATVCMCAGLHYFAAMGRQNSAQMLKLRSVLISKTAYMFSMGYLQSLAALTAPKVRGGQGNTRSAQDREAMAREWFGMHHLQYRLTVPVLDGEVEAMPGPGPE